CSYEQVVTIRKGMTMKNLKKLFLVTTAIGASLMVSGVANAAVGSAAAVTYVSGSGTPAATVSFGSTSATHFISAETSGAFGITGLFTPGNNFTLTLPTGNTFAALPTITLSGGGTLNYNNGGASQNFVTYQVQGATTSTSVISITGVAAQNVSSVTDGSTVNISITDSGNALVNVSASAKRLTVATFSDPYSFSFATANTAPQVDLSATAPGSRYTNSNTAQLGTITVTPTSVPLIAWNGSTLASTSTTSNLVVTLPAGTNPSVTLTGGGTCAQSSTVTSISTSNTVTFSNVSLPAPNTGACTLAVSVASPTTGTTLLGAGAASAVLTVGLSPTTNLVGTTRTFSPSLSTITYANGTVVNAGYVTGNSNSYDNFISVTTGAIAGPVIVSLAGGRADTATSGTAVLNSAQAANTNVLYPIGDLTGAGIGASIRTALQGAGVSTAALATDSDRGSLQVVVPTGSRVAPLIRNRTNGQIVEVGRQ
ncbi:MAG: hypothetical protein ACOYJ6_19980, partial [Caulobacterales bacterium]